MNAMQKCLFIGLFLMLPGIAGAQSVDALVERGERAGIERALLENLQERATGAGLDVAETARLIEPAVTLAEQDLPARAVVQRAMEGLAKGVLQERIHQVLAHLREATEQAGQRGDAWLQRPEVQGMLGGGAAASEEQARSVVIESLAQAFARDVPADALEAALERLPVDVRPGRASVAAIGAALQILPDLPVATLDPDLAAGLLSQALNSGFATSDLRRLPAALEAAGRRGDMPAEAVARGTLSGIAQGTPAETILARLFQGRIPGQPFGSSPPGLDQRPDGRQGGPPGGS